MRSSEFEAYKARYRAAIRQVLSEAEPGRLDEIGFPAYSHTNPLINWLFWKRLHTVIDHVEEDAPYDRVLDFGCGSGVMLPFLSKVSRRVVAVDVDLVPLEHMIKHVPLSPNVQAMNISTEPASPEALGSFDLIIALDIIDRKDLEIIKEIALGINKILCEYLKARGIVLVDFKIEFGKRNGSIILGDEISMDSMRLWDAKTGDSMDKDVYRFDKGDVMKSYESVAARIVDNKERDEP